MMLDRLVSRSSWLPPEKKGVLHIRLENLSFLYDLYGEAKVRKAVQDALAHRLKTMGLEVLPGALSDSHLWVDAGRAAECNWSDDDVFLERLKASLSYPPIKCGDISFFLRVSANFAADRSDDAIPAIAVPAAETLAEDKADMATAVTLLTHLREARIVVAFQSVRYARKQDREVYSECQLWHYLERGALVPCDPEIPALERMNLVSRLDSSLLWAAIQILEEQEERHLACRISARSLQFDGWWRRLQDYLECHPRIAERLTLIVAGTTSVVHVGEAVSMLDVMRILGCRIVVDRISQPELAGRIEPDAIKIPVEQLAEGGLVPSQGWLIVAGIESRQQLAVAMEAGAHCIQGDFIARPGMLPAWRSRPVVLADSMAPQHRSLHPDGVSLAPSSQVPF